MSCPRVWSWPIFLSFLLFFSTTTSTIRLAGLLVSFVWVHGVPRRAGRTGESVGSGRDDSRDTAALHPRLLFLFACYPDIYWLCGMIPGVWVASTALLSAQGRPVDIPRSPLLWLDIWGDGGGNEKGAAAAWEGMETGGWKHGGWITRTGWDGREGINGAIFLFDPRDTLSRANLIAAPTLSSCDQHSWNGGGLAFQVSGCLNSSPL